MKTYRKITGIVFAVSIIVMAAAQILASNMQSYYKLMLAENSILTGEYLSCKSFWAGVSETKVFGIIAVIALVLFLLSLLTLLFEKNKGEIATCAGLRKKG